MRSGWRSAGELGTGCPIDRLDELSPRSFVVDSTLRHVVGGRLAPASDAVYESAVPRALREAGAVLGVAYVFVAYDVAGGVAREREWVVVFSGEAE